MVFRYLFWCETTLEPARELPGPRPFHLDNGLDGSPSQLSLHTAPALILTHTQSDRGLKPNLELGGNAANLKVARPLLLRPPGVALHPFGHHGSDGKRH